MSSQISRSQSGNITEGNYYSIKSHGGIGDELGDNPKNNLSASCHELRIQINGEILRILVDVGAYQGRGKIERDIKKVSEGVSAIILTHPHMDHIGDFPKIFTEGSVFGGRVFSTLGTLHASEVALVDAAKILQREYEKKYAGWQKTTEEIAAAFYAIKSIATPNQKQVPRTKKGDRVSETGEQLDKKTILETAYTTLEKHGISLDMQDTWRQEMKNREPEKPAYTIEDVYRALSSIETHSIRDGWKELVPGQVAFRFYNAGHIIGSISVLFRITQGKKSKYILFSGDLGSYKWDMHPTGLAIPPYNLPIDTVMIESTYGNKIREDFEIGFADFKANLIRDLGKYGRVIISTFAMDRTQNILARLVKMKQTGEIDTDIILDSPAGTNHTQAYVQATKNIDELLIRPKAQSIQKLLSDDFDERERILLEEFATYIDPINSHYTIANKDNRESLFADSTSGKTKIVLTASGMADGGMVIQHLQANIADPTTVFYFPGYLVPGTLGYALANKDQPGGQKKRVIIEGETYEVKARMKQFNFLSGHGDAEDLRAWLLAIKHLRNIRIVHGDVDGSSLEFAHSLERDGGFSKQNIIVPHLGEENIFSLDSLTTQKTTTRKATPRPLTIEPAPERKKRTPPRVPVKTKKGVEKILPPKKVVGTPVKLSGKNGATEKRLREIRVEIRAMYYSFGQSLASLPIPFLEDVRRYYIGRTQLDALLRKRDSLQGEIRRNTEKLIELKSPTITGNDKNQGIEQETQTRLTTDFSLLEKYSGDISQLEQEMSAYPLKEKLSVHAISKGIIESLGYTDGEIEAVPDKSPCELGDIESIVPETLRKILAYEDAKRTTGYYAKVEALLSSLSDEGNKELLQIDLTDIESIFHSLIAFLIGKINAQYEFPYPQVREDSTHKHLNPRKLQPKVPVQRNNKAVIEKQNLEEKRQRLQENLLELERMKEIKGKLPRNKSISQGKYGDLPMQDIEKRLKEKRRELLTCERSISRKLSKITTQK